MTDLTDRPRCIKCGWTPPTVRRPGGIVSWDWSKLNAEWEVDP